jgi:hypothetical protein
MGRGASRGASAAAAGDLAGRARFHSLSRIYLLYRCVLVPRLAHFIDSVTVVSRFAQICSGTINEMCELWPPDGRNGVQRVAKSAGATAHAGQRR